MNLSSTSVFSHTPLVLLDMAAIEKYLLLDVDGLTIEVTSIITDWPPLDITLHHDTPHSTLRESLRFQLRRLTQRSFIVQASTFITQVRLKKPTNTQIAILISYLMIDRPTKAD